MIGDINYDWSSDVDNRKSISCCIFMLCKALISGVSKKQNVVALSSCEVEYISVAYGAS